MTAGTPSVQLLAQGGYDIENKEYWENIVLAGMKAGNQVVWGVGFGKYDPEKLIRAIDKHYQKDMYIEIDYDAPLPKRMK